MTRRHAQAAEPVEPDRQEDDFLAFWEAEDAKRQRKTTTILGVVVEVPVDLPLRFERMLAEMGDSSADEDVQELLTVLFGQDPMDAWVEAGCTGGMFKTLLAWGVANGQGKPTSFAEAKRLVDEAEKAEAEGKAPTRVKPNRADRRASSATRASAKAGRSSSPTSGASTASRRKPSPA